MPSGLQGQAVENPVAARLPGGSGAREARQETQRRCCGRQRGLGRGEGERAGHRRLRDDEEQWRTPPKTKIVTPPKSDEHEATLLI